MPYFLTCEIKQNGSNHRSQYNRIFLSPHTSPTKWGLITLSYYSIDRYPMPSCRVIRWTNRFSHIDPLPDNSHASSLFSFTNRRDIDTVVALFSMENQILIIVPIRWHWWIVTLDDNDETESFLVLSRDSSSTSDDHYSSGIHIRASVNIEVSRRHFSDTSRSAVIFMSESCFYSYDFKY